MPRLTDYHHFDGLHWSTGYLTNALAYQGVVAPHTGAPYSEALLMGINGGLCAGYFAFEYEGYDPHLHFLTRYLFDEQPGAAFDRLAIPTIQQRTADPLKAVANVVSGLARGKPVVVWADVTRLEGTGDPAMTDYHLVMPVLVYGYDGGLVQLADRAGVGSTADAAEFEAARASVKKHKFRAMTLDAPDARKLPDAVRGGIQACIEIFVGQPPVGQKSSFGFDAYQKWIRLLTSPAGKQSWHKMFAPGRRMICGLTSAYQSLELYFTGGRGGRAVYADFLDEAAIILDEPALREVAAEFRTCAAAWAGFTVHLLPDDVPPLAELRRLLERDYALFVAEGYAARPARREIVVQLDALKARLGADFPLGEAAAALLRARLADGLAAIHDAEARAIAALRAVMADAS